MSTTFADLGLPAPILEALTACGYTIPTPIQEQAIPVILSGRDLIGAAQTGTGKTAAFALPTLARLAGPKGTLPRCLVLTPTRELAMQVEENFKKYGTTAGLRVALIYGGVGFDAQLKLLRDGVDVIVATPGRMLDLWEKGHLKLDEIQTLILDEVDRMLDMGFIEDVSRIINICPKNRQTLLFSATADESIARIAKWALTDPIRVDVRTGTGAADTVDHCLYPVDSYQKYDLLIELLKKLDFKSVIVFTRTKRDADRISEWVAGGGHAVATMHADRSQTERFEALQGFKSGKYPVLVATDVAARGLDVRGVTHVINYNVPDHPEDYVHRIGRTGRANTDGEAVTLYSPDELHPLKAIEQLIGRTIERRKLESFKYRFEPDLGATVTKASSMVTRRRNR
jgi:ATP-dependent RNA helicase RhlE